MVRVSRNNPRISKDITIELNSLTLKKWNTLIYVELVLKFLHVILVLLKMDERFKKRKKRKPKRPPSLYVKANVLKEAFKCSLRHSKSGKDVPEAKNSF